MSFVNFFKKSDKEKDSISPSYDSESTYEIESSDKYKKDKKDKYREKYRNDRDDRDTRYDREDRDSRDDRDDRDTRDDREDRDSRENRDDRDSRENRDDRDSRENRDDRDSRDDRDDRDSRDDIEEYEYSKRNRGQERMEEYDPRKDQSIKNLDNFLYKKNIQILKIFKMKNRCILLLVLMKELGKCILIYVDPSRYQIECQYNNSIVGRDNIHDIELFRIDHKNIYEVCDCYPELMKLTQEHRIDIENEKNKVYLNHFEQICIQLNNF